MTRQSFDIDDGHLRSEIGTTRPFLIFINKKTAFISISLVVIAFVAVIVGLSVGLSKDKDSQTPFTDAQKFDDCLSLSCRNASAVLNSKYKINKTLKYTINKNFIL